MMTAGDGLLIPFPVSSRRRATRGKSKKGFVQTVKEEARSVIKAVGKLVEKMGSTMPLPKRRRNTPDFAGPFVPPI
jgi:hypothetical protein